MRISNRGLDLIKQFEGLYLRTYICPANVPTIGWGTTKINGRPVPSGLVITKQQAEQYLLNDLVIFERGVNRLVQNINQNQFDALVSFAYNLGLGALTNSTLLRLVRANPNDPQIRNQFMRWTRASGIELAGLVRRRRAEADLYFSTNTN